ncbi:ABC transporter substrate-binding protein [Streptomyces sp. NPDC050560]|uniref:ABC transporter substrate-binding protein n=1 Tax=Streptomyces sp. NPDC050560 TaxID=3365630 RepID=UPI00378E28F3
MFQTLHGKGRLVRRTTVAVVVTAAALTVIAGGFEPANPRKADDTTAGGGGQSVDIGLLGVMSDAPIAIADKRGYFKKAGITLKIQKFASGGAMVAPMAAGDLDVGGGAFSAGLVNAVAGGTPLVITADKGSFPSKDLGSQQFVVRKNLAGRIKDFSDLRGRKIAVGTAVGTAPYASVVDVLRRAGLPKPQDQLSSMASTDVTVALDQGAVDAAWLSEPNAALAVQKGYAVPWKSAYDVAPDEQDATIFYNTRWSEANPKLAQAFMNAYVCGARDYLAAMAPKPKAEKGGGGGDGGDRGAVMEIMADYTHTDVKVLEKAHPPGLFDGAVPDVKSIEHTVETFRNLGEIKRTVPADKLVDLDYVKAAAHAHC